VKPVADFFPRILPHVISCPAPFAEQSLVDAAIEFCDKSLVIRYTPDSVNTEAGLAAYDFDIPTNQEYSRVVYVTVNGKKLKSLPTIGLPVKDNVSDTIPTHFYVTQNESEVVLNLFPAPDKVYPIEMSIVLRPVRGAKYLDDDLFVYWHEALTHGALYRLKSTPGQPYSDLVSAGIHKAAAYTMCHNARIEGNMGRVVGSSSVKQQPFVR
jgi:hypothetical protein